MANIKGITIELAGDNSKLAKALDQTKSQLVATSKELSSVKKNLKLDPSNITMLTQKQELLTKAIKSTSERLDQLKDLQQQFGDKSKLTEEQKEKYRLLEREIAQCEGQLKQYESQQKEVNNTIDKVNSGQPFEELKEDIDKTGNSALKAGDIIKAHVISEAIISGIKKLGSAIKGVANSLQEWSDMSDALKEQEAKLTRVLKNTTNASDAQIKSIIDLTAKEEKLGVVSQETQLAGLQELGTYIEHEKTLKKLLPVMNDMIAQQYGVGASMESASSIATMMGKVLGNGQVSALSKLGYKFDKTQEKVLKFGSEEKKAAMLAQVISQSVGGMNKALAQTEKGIEAINTSKFEDLKKSVGETYSNIKSKLVATISQHLLPTLEKATNAVKKWASSVNWDKVGNTIKNAITKVIDVFKWIINNSRAIIAALGGVAAGFAAIKLGDLITKISSLNGLLPTVTSLLTKLNLTALTNPYIALAAGITAVVTGLSLWISSSAGLSEAQRIEREELRKSKETVDEYNESMQDLANTRQEKLNESMSEIDYYQGLYNELKNITNANGKVKKGYEDRAGFIVSTLNDALGTEIKMTDGVIKKYDKLEESINNVIEAKRTQALVEAHEDEYNKARDKKVELEKAYGDAVDINNKREEKRQESIQKLADYFKITNEELQTFIKENGSIDSNALENYLKKSQQMGDLVSVNTVEFLKLSRELRSASESYKESSDILEENRVAYENNQKTIVDYETALTGLKNKNYEVVSSIYEDTHTFVGKTDEETYNNYQKQINMQEDYIKQLEKNTKGYNDDYVKKEIEKHQNTIDELKKAQAKYLSATDEGLKNVEVKWSDSLSKQLSLVTDSNIEFKTAANGNMEMYIDGIKAGETKSKDEMAKLVTATIKEISKKETDSEAAGINLIEGINKGIANQSKQSSVFKSIANFGTKILNKLKSSLQEHSPSKATNEMGQFIDEGIIIGIEKKQRDVLKSVSKFGTNVISGLNNSISSGVNIKGTLNDYQNAMKSLNKGVEASVNPVINPTANSNPLYITIEKFYNNRETDIKQLAEELEFYRKNSALAKGGS